MGERINGKQDELTLVIEGPPGVVHISFLG